MTKITVGIAAYRTDFLVAAIGSVLAQTFQDFELLVSDDSPDGSAGAIVRRFQDPRIRLIEGLRRGLVANRAHLWEHASADVLKYLDDDDLLFPEALQELSRLMERDPRFVMAASRRVIIDAFGRELRRPISYQTDDWMWFEPAQLANHLVRTTINALGEPSNLLIRRSAFGGAECLAQVAGLGISRLSNVALVLNSTSAGPVAASGKVLAARREHPGQSSARESSLDLLEWEVCLRAAVQMGLVTPQAALDGAMKIEQLYRGRGGPYPEVHHFYAQLSALKTQLGGGDRDVVTAQFVEDLSRAHATVIARQQSAPSLAASQPATQQAGQVQAKIAFLSRRRARGWAWIPDAPEQRLEVEALLGDRVVGHATANLHHPEAATWNVGADDYGFEMDFYAPLTADETPVFRVFAGAETVTPRLTLPPLEGDAPTIGEGADKVLEEHARFTAPGPLFEEFASVRDQHAPHRQDGPDPLLMAFYLTQFHAIPENDRNWGQGFTEWRQLPRALPRFPGHYQPRIPRDLGFYNLLDEEVLRRQCEMAKASGVGAFAFYYYWFNRRRVLERPVELFLRSDTDMPFMIIWANENWTRGWDGSDEKVLLQQNYDREDEDALLDDIARHMSDPRYLKLEGRPLFVIYNPAAVPDTIETFARWRQIWHERHGLQPLFYMAQTFGRDDPRPYGLDGALEFPPHKLNVRIPARDTVDAFSKSFSGRVMRYEALAEASLAEPAAPFPLIKTAIPGWDNDARRPNRSSIFEGSTPQAYEAWLQALIEKAMERPAHGTPLVAINAWNEWAEGAYLEPDVHFGSAYLNATGRALNAAIRKRNGVG